MIILLMLLGVKARTGLEPVIGDLQSPALPPWLSRQFATNLIGRSHLSCVLPLDERALRHVEESNFYLIAGQTRNRT